MFNKYKKKLGNRNKTVVISQIQLKILASTAQTSTAKHSL